MVFAVVLIGGLWLGVAGQVVVVALLVDLVGTPFLELRVSNGVLSVLVDPRTSVVGVIGNKVGVAFPVDLDATIKLHVLVVLILLIDTSTAGNGKFVRASLTKASERKSELRVAMSLEVSDGETSHRPRTALGEDCVLANISEERGMSTENESRVEKTLLVFSEVLLTAGVLLELLNEISHLVVELVLLLNQVVGVGVSGTGVGVVVVEELVLGVAILEVDLDLELGESVRGVATHLGAVVITRFFTHNVVSDMSLADRVESVVFTTVHFLLLLGTALFETLIAFTGKGVNRSSNLDRAVLGTLARLILIEGLAVLRVFNRGAALGRASGFITNFLGIVKVVLSVALGVLPEVLTLVGLLDLFATVLFKRLLRRRSTVIDVFKTIGALHLSAESLAGLLFTFSAATIDTLGLSRHVTETEPGGEANALGLGVNTVLVLGEVETSTVHLTALVLELTFGGDTGETNSEREPLRGSSVLTLSVVLLGPLRTCVLDNLAALLLKVGLVTQASVGTARFRSLGALLLHHTACQLGGSAAEILTGSLAFVTTSPADREERKEVTRGTDDSTSAGSLGVSAVLSVIFKEGSTGTLTALLNELLLLFEGAGKQKHLDLLAFGAGRAIILHRLTSKLVG